VKGVVHREPRATVCQGKEGADRRHAVLRERRHDCLKASLHRSQDFAEVSGGLSGLKGACRTCYNAANVTGARNADLKGTSQKSRRGGDGEGLHFGWGGGKKID